MPNEMTTERNKLKKVIFDLVKISEFKILKMYK